jgi:alginate production protein
MKIDHTTERNTNLGGRLAPHLLLLLWLGVAGSAVSSENDVQFTLLPDGETRFAETPRAFSILAPLGYWNKLAFLYSSEELSNEFNTRVNARVNTRAMDIWATYRFSQYAFAPDVTLGYAARGGNNSPNDKTNHMLHQTSLQLNKSRFAGFSNFNIYGQTLDPDLSSLQIFTLGMSLRPTPNVTLDLNYHRYHFAELSDTLRDSALTAEVNRIKDRNGRLSSGVDMMIGFHNLFGVQRLTVDVRAGWFYSGTAFARNDSIDKTPTLNKGNKGVAVLAKFSW